MIGGTSHGGKAFRTMPGTQAQSDVSWLLLLFVILGAESENPIITTAVCAALRLALGLQSLTYLPRLLGPCGQEAGVPRSQ